MLACNLQEVGEDRSVCYQDLIDNPRNTQRPLKGGVRVCGDAVLRYFWCGFAQIFILTCGIEV